MTVYEGSEPIGLAPDGKTIIDGNGRAVANLALGGYADILLNGMEFLGVPFDLSLSGGADSFTNGNIEGVLMPVKAGIPLKGMRLFMVGHAVGTDPTGVFLGITELDGTRRATTGNIVADGQWKGPTATFVNFDFLTPWTPAADGVVIAAHLVDGSWSGADPTFANNNIGFGNVSPPNGWPAASFDYITAGTYSDIPDPVPDWGPGGGLTKWLTFYRT